MCKNLAIKILLQNNFHYNRCPQKQVPVCAIEFLNAEVQPINNYKHLVNVYGGKTVDVRTVRKWVFQSGDRDVSNKPCSGFPSTATNEKKKHALMSSLNQTSK